MSVQDKLKKMGVRLPQLPARSEMLPVKSTVPREDVEVDENGQPIYKRCPNCGGYHG